MRKIQIKSWKAKGLDGKENDEDLTNVLSVLISNKKPEEIPRGIDNFRLFGRIVKAFDKAKKDKVLELEEAEYNFIKNDMDKEVPATWGANKNISEAIESFLDAKQE